jgi:hypothetical protein
MNTSTPTGVCIDCFADYALKNYVSKNHAVEWCNFCCRNSDCKIAADPSDVLAYFENCLSHDWEAPEDCLYYDSREGGWQTGGLAVVYDGYDLIQEVFSDCFENSKLLEYFSYELSDNNYVETSFARLSAGEVYQYSWESFTHTVKHRKRYLFSQINDTEAEASDEELIPTASFVNVISGYIVSNSLIIEVPVGTKFYRVRIYETPFELTGQKLGTSPVEKANYSNRMSPAGIAMFYGGLAEETALIETIDNDVNRAQNKKAAIGKFQTLRTLRIVDFTKLPRIPSLFDDELRELRDGLTILHAFIKDLSKPIKKDGREHIEYVPTQIITEFIRDFLKVNGQRIDGIYYPSSRNGKPACVLFIDNDNCVDSHDDTEGILLLEQPVETIDALSWHTSVYSQKK